MIIFQRMKQINEWYRMDEKLGLIMSWLLNEYNDYGIIITSIERTRAEQIVIYSQVINPKTGQYYRQNEVPLTVHGTKPCRGLDGIIVDKNRKIVSMRKHLKIERHINDIFIYDPKRPQYKVAIYHKVGNGGYHMHFQCHSRTIKRNV